MVRLFGASVIGAAHLQYDQPCHDAHYTKRIGENHVFAAVSDGMGSAKHADIGSRLASECIVDNLSESLDETMSDDEIIAAIKEGFVKTHERLQEEAEITDIDIKDLNCTLMVFVAFSEERQFYGQVGDCVTVGKDNDGHFIMIHPQRGDYANLTYSICTLQSVEDGEYGRVNRPASRVAMMSDGVESLCIKQGSDEVSALFFEPFYKAFDADYFDETAASESLVRFLESERINKKTDDDKTLLFIAL